MGHQLTPARGLTPDDFITTTPKKKETMTPGLETTFELPQVGFTSEFIPLEDPFGVEIPSSTSLLEAVLSDYENSSLKQFTSIHLDHKTAEPGVQINYELLNQMISVPKRMPEAYITAFKALATARVRYFAAYQVYLAEKRTTADSFAMGKLLHQRQQDMRANPEIYSGNFVMKTQDALQRSHDEFARQKQRFQVCKGGLIKCMNEFIHMKAVVVPYINRLKEAFVELQRRCKKKKEDERLERERVKKEMIEKKKLAMEKLRRAKAEKAALRQDAATQARMAAEAQAWAAYLARSKRRREEETVPSDSRGEKRVNMGY
ncbi:hypothetical protein FQN49_001550 [Arthroderma sp. PD_2]|nr:hypothetical protein FQN49_001550 [Arthroderma sp. PD_2]